MADDCPWCEEPLAADADPVRVVPARGRGDGQLLHHRCAVEWEQFITRAQRLATSGTRWSLLDGPLAKGWELESGVSGNSR